MKGFKYTNDLMYHEVYFKTGCDPCFNNSTDPFIKLWTLLLAIYV